VNSPTTQLTGETVAAAPDFISLTADALGTVEDIFTEAKDAISKNVIVEGRVSGSALEMNQYQAHGLAWLATYVESLRQMLAWSRNLTEAGTYGDTESLIMGIACGEYTAQIFAGIPMSQTETIRLSDLGITDAEHRKTDAIRTLIAAGNTPRRR